MKNLVALNEIIHPELEPGVINHDMIKASYRQRYKGEAARLKDLEPIDYEKITVMLLEFKNILRVDHLWVLPNLTKLSLNFNKLENIESIDMLIHLKELDLSFNYIEKIENLQNLIKLETLSLFNNLIKKIENLEKLENLIILSLGNNKITSFKGIETFRFFKKLKVLNLDGNPVTENDPNCRYYIASVLPNLRYYKYIYISDEEREEGNNKFVRELRDIANNEENEVIMRAAYENEKLERSILEDSFIEDFREQYFFDLFFDTKSLEKMILLLAPENDGFFYDFKNAVLDIGKKMYNNGFQKFQERKNELQLFTEYTERGLEASHKKGRKLIESFIDIKDEIHKSVKKQFHKIETFRMQGIEGSAMELVEPNDEIERLSEDYHARIDELWENVLKQEVHLFESMEESINILGETLTVMVSDFITEFNIYYQQLREHLLKFCQQLVNVIAGLKDFNEVPEDVQIWINLKGGIKNTINLYKNRQIQKILNSEEFLVSNAKKWLEKLIETKTKDDIKRNRDKIIEINYFLEQMRELFVQTSLEIQEEMVQEQPEA